MDSICKNCNNQNVEEVCCICKHHYEDKFNGSDNIYWLKIINLINGWNKNVMYVQYGRREVPIKRGLEQYKKWFSNTPYVDMGVDIIGEYAKVELVFDNKHKRIVDGKFLGEIKSSDVIRESIYYGS